MVIAPAFRACRLRVVVTDCDGVLTDAGVFYTRTGEVCRRFSVRDGLGVERLRAAGIATLILSGEDCGSIRRRAEKLALPHVFLGVRDKRAFLPALLGQIGVGMSDLAYIGDDLNDLEIIEAIGRSGLTAAPADAWPEGRRAVHFVCAQGGGQGAFREFAEWILRLRGQALGAVSEGATA